MSQSSSKPVNPGPHASITGVRSPEHSRTLSVQTHVPPTQIPTFWVPAGPV